PVCGVQRRRSPAVVRLRGGGARVDRPWDVLAGRVLRTPGPVRCTPRVVSVGDRDPGQHRHSRGPASSAGGRITEGKRNMSLRAVKRVVQSKPTLEGAGVRLRRAFGFGNTTDFDPFLLLDDFRNDNPDDYLAGFPWHPHRGIETITYVLNGAVEHGDSLGNRGEIGPGDIQWMTAGSGIVSPEMPKGDEA